MYGLWGPGVNTVVFLNYSLANCLKHCLSLDRELNDWLVSSWHLLVSRETTCASPKPASAWGLGSELRFSGLFSGYQQVLGLLRLPSPSVPTVANTNNKLMSRGFPVTQSIYHEHISQRTITKLLLKQRTKIAARGTQHLGQVNTQLLPGDTPKCLHCPPSFRSP